MFSIQTGSIVQDLILNVLIFIIGTAVLVKGSDLFIDSAANIARRWGVSELVIGLTLVSIGTSLPELATSCIAAAKGKGRLALGNVLGSNTFNILLILGGSAVIHPLNMDNISFIDYTAVFMCALSLVLFSWTGMRNRIDRLEGVVLVLLQVLYFAYLFLMR